MFNLSQDNKNEFLVVFVLVAIGFLLRLYASFTVPLVYDEPKKIELAQEINFNFKNLNLPLGNERTHNPPLLLYLMKGSSLLFGVNKVAMRLPSVLIGSLTLLISYMLVRAALDKKTAFVCLLLMTFSQFYIGSTRVAWEDGLLPFFTVSVIFVIQKALETKNKAYVYVAGFIAGLGLMAKMTFLTLLPPVIFYLFFYPRNRHIFSLKELVLFLLIIIIIISPNIYWNLQNSSVDYQSQFGKADFLSFSLIPTALYVGEVVVFGMYNFCDSIFHWVFSYEYPFLNWLMGLICIAGAFYFLRNRKNDFISLLSWIFWSIYIFFSIVRAKTGGGFYFHLDNFWWAVVSVVPGFILGSAMLVDLSNRYKKFRYVLFLIVCYFMVHAIHFVNFPANCFIPRASIRAEELSRTAQDYLKEGEKADAKKVYTYLRKYYPGYICDDRKD